MVDCSIFIGDIVTEAKYSLRRFGDYVQINSFNPTDSSVPHLTVIFSEPKKDDMDLRAQHLRSIDMFFRNPTMNFSGYRSEDFEPGYEKVLKEYSLPFPITENQKKIYIRHPTYQPSLDHYGFKTGLDPEKWQEQYYRRKKAFNTISAGLEVRKSGVYKPKPQLSKDQNFLGSKGVVKHIARQTKITRLESHKYFIDDRQEGIRTIIPDVIYYIKNLGPIVGEVKPWTLREKDTLEERAAQLSNYDAMLKYHNNDTTPIALVIPEISSVAELYNLETIREKTGRQFYVFSISTKKYLRRVYKNKKEKLEHLLKVAEGMSAKQLKYFLTLDMDECKKELALLETTKNGFEL